MCTQARTATAARAALTAATALVAAATLAAGAQAGQYHVYSCRTPTGQPASTEGWSAPEHSGEDTTTNTCEDADGGLIAGLDDGYVHSAHSTSDKASWLFKAPLGETVVAARLWRAGNTPGGSNEYAYYAAYAESTPLVGEAEAFDVCSAWQPCTSEGTFSDPLAPSNLVTVPEGALPSNYISLNTACGSTIVGDGCPEGKDDPSGYAATIELFAADLTLSQSEAPVVSGVGGSLAQAATVSGTSDVAFEAHDGGSGIYEVVFRVDGEVRSTVFPAEAGGPCHNVGSASEPAFLYARPCPTALSVDLPFDTTGLANGAHDLLVSVLDAAGNSATVLERKITVDNAAAPGGSSSDGNGSGDSGSSGASASGSNPTGTSPAVDAASGAGGNTPAVAPGPANGTNASAQATLTASWRGHAGERLNGAYGAARTVEGRLTAPGGVPIAAAQIEVSELPAYAGAKARALPTPRTGPAGRWSLALPRGISSSELRFAYRSQLASAAPVATRTLDLSVRAGLTLSIAPRVARAQGDIRFAGRLLGGPVPAGGKQVVLEARSPGGHWLEFHVIRGRSGDGGRFHFTYRFRLPGPVKYQFRVLSEAEADYPFAAGSSNVVGVYEQ
jgi:hypothetical protein